jgi:hypothetical protein
MSDPRSGYKRGAASSALRFRADGALIGHKMTDRQNLDWMPPLTWRITSQ